MEKITIEKDIKVLCLRAMSFPDDMIETHRKLRMLFLFNGKRQYFGLSHLDHDKEKILYRAAAEELEEDEVERLHCESFTIKSGEYASITIPDFMKDISAVGKVFAELLRSPNVDPEAYCLEWYLNDTDVRCMVPLK